MVFFVLTQKTAYELRISDWSSDVCSSDLPSPGITKESRGSQKRAGDRKRKARAEARAVAPLASRRSEGQPALLLAEFHIADIGAEPRADTDPDRDQHDIAAPQIGGVDTAAQLGRAFAFGEARGEILGIGDGRASGRERVGKDREIR